MDYPSTTQALFALIVMIIVLAFILVYCCWGTFSCAESRDPTMSEGNAESGQLPTGDSNHSLFILPYRSMIYIGDGQTRQVYQIPLREDKPPSYKDIFNNLQPPPFYSGSVSFLDEDQPPTYEDCVRNGDQIGVRLAREGNMSTSSCSFSPRLESLSSSAVSAQYHGITSLSKLRRSSFSSVFRARSLLTGITSSSSRLPHTSQFQPQRLVSLTLSPFLVTLPGDSKHKSFNSFTTSSSPCLPASCESTSKSNT